ncbi:MAG: hypothetical protein NTV52_33660 [Acidobacteria bacterium]|nr:hypothetical protein [Acidobacteriota bacterium]
MGITIKGSGSEFILRLQEKAKLTAADKVYIGERQKARILRRTESGRDVNGSAFAEYSTGPFYWSPTGRLSRRSAAKAGEGKTKAAVNRYAKKLGAGKAVKGGAPYVSRSGLTICFPGGYRQFKQYLGRTGVDLRGAKAPHMLQAIQVKPTGDGVSLGIYGEQGALAAKHNAGRGVPKREFFGVSGRDKREAVADARARVREKLKSGLS